MAEGVEKVDIAHKEQHNILMSTPGVYGIKCKVHNRHGMFALVVVGDVKPYLEKKRRLNDVGERVYKKL